MKTLASAKGEIVFSLKLYQCEPRYARFSPDHLDHAMAVGKTVAKIVDAHLAARCLKDPLAFADLRELIRCAMVAVAAGAAPPEGLRRNPLSLDAMGLLWLTLHEPKASDRPEFDAPTPA